MLECASDTQRARLRTTYQYDAMPPNRQCAVAACGYRWTHSTEAHHCDSCGMRAGEHTPMCPEWRVVDHAAGDAADDAEGGAEGGAASTPPPTTIVVACPTCRQLGPVDLSDTLYTGAECCICFQAGPVVAFRKCRHANTCAACVQRLHDAFC